MQKVEIELGDDGKPGTLPEPLQQWVDGLIKSEHGRAYAKARAEAAKAGVSIADLERLKALEEENQRYQVAEAERQKDWEKARAMLEQAAAKERDKLSADLQAERQRALNLARRTVREQVRAAALQAGAHSDFLDDFTDLVMTRSAIDFDMAQDYAPLLKGDAGAAPLDVAAHVKTMLDARPNFKAAPAAGGGARGGYNARTGAAPTSEADAAFVAAASRVQQGGDRSAAALEALVEATFARNRAQTR